jgi:hypothetical protein
MSKMGIGSGGELNIAAVFHEVTSVGIDQAFNAFDEPFRRVAAKASVQTMVIIAKVRST